MPARSLRRLLDSADEFTGFNIEGGGEFAERRGMTIRDEFFIERKGVRMVLYAGLLDEAHQHGLRSISTELIQCPTEANGDTAIIKAEVTLEPEQNKILRYEGYGDASPSSVGKMIVPHLIRMAETRAKARALRDAVNVGAVSLEELGDDQPEERQQTPQKSTQNTSEMPERTEGGATRKQLNFMLSQLPEHRKNQLEEKHGPVEKWSKDAVRATIDKLKSKQGSG